MFVGTMAIIWNISFVISFAIIAPEYFVFAATGMSKFAREHAKDFCLWSDYFVFFYKINGTRTFLLWRYFW